ncbi:hypothetical protein BGZ74_004619, partial [Mortierella antarctica]
MDALFGHRPNITPLCEHGDEDDLTVGQPAAQDKPLQEQVIEVDSRFADDLDEGEVDFNIDDLAVEEDELAVDTDKDNDVYEDLELDQVSDLSILAGNPFKVQKRPLSDTQSSTTSTKRPRARDQRKAPPSLETGPPQ